MKNPAVRNEDIIWRRIEDKVVLIGQEGTVIHVLNKTAARIWELCDGVNGPDEISADLYEHYDVTPGEANGDVQTTLDKFAGMGLINYNRKGVNSG